MIVPAYICTHQDNKGSREKKKQFFFQENEQKENLCRVSVVTPPNLIKIQTRKTI